MFLSTLPHKLEMRNVFVWTQQLACVFLSDDCSIIWYFVYGWRGDGVCNFSFFVVFSSSFPCLCTLYGVWWWRCWYCCCTYRFGWSEYQKIFWSVWILTLNSIRFWCYVRAHTHRNVIIQIEAFERFGDARLNSSVHMVVSPC